LHHERVERGHKRVHPIPAPLVELPDGAMVVAAGRTRAASPRRWIADTALHADGARLRLSTRAPSVDHLCLRLAPCLISRTHSGTA
jgi:hypothetical protein